MSSLQEIKKKIVSSQSTLKITKAMEMISAAKLKKLEQLDSNSKNYLDLLKEILFTSIAELKDQDLEFLKTTKNNNVLIIVIGLDKGLVGSLKSKLLVSTQSLIEDLKSKGTSFRIAALKKKTAEILSSYGIKVDYSFVKENQSLEIEILKNLIFSKTNEASFEEVYLLYAKFNNPFDQQVEIERILPFQNRAQRVESSDEKKEVFTIEIDDEEFLQNLLEEYIEAQINYFLNNASLSENAARMVAMKKASENSKEIIKSLQLKFNKERQNKITQQIQETIRFNN